MNRIELIGRFTTDPVLRKTASNKSVASVTIAVARQYDREQTDFINVVIWNALADNVAKYTHKGSLVGVDGNLQMRKYTDKDGKERTTYEVVASGVEFLDSKPKNESVDPDDPILEQNVDWGMTVNTDDLPF